MWNAVITDLEASGLQLKEIAERCECAVSTLSDLKQKRSKDCSYSLGERLVSLHKVRCKGRRLDPKRQRAAA